MRNSKARSASRANEGKILAIVASEDVDLALKALSPHSLGKDSLGEHALYRIAHRCDESSIFRAIHERHGAIVCLIAERCSVQFP
jgi:hypothetical protein